MNEAATRRTAGVNTIRMSGTSMQTIAHNKLGNIARFYLNRSINKKKIRRKNDFDKVVLITEPICGI